MELGIHLTIVINKVILHNRETSPQLINYIIKISRYDHQHLKHPILQ